MTGTLPPSRRILPVDRFAGIAPQFERTDGGYHFRRHGAGPAIRVTAAEFDAFVVAARWSVALHGVAMTICSVAAWLVVKRMLPDASDTVVAIVYGIVLPPLALAIYASLTWNADAPARALADRPAERAARQPEPVRRPAYGTIVAATVALLVLAALGTQQPPSFYVWFATVVLVGGLFAIVRRWWFDQGLTAEARRRLAIIERHEGERTAARQRGGTGSPWRSVLLIMLSVVQIVAMIGGFIGTIAFVAAIAGTPAAQASGTTLAIGIIGGFVVAGLLTWLVERLGQRWTGESPGDVFSFIPAGW